MARSLTEWLDYIGQQHPVSIDMGLARVGEVACRMDIGRPGRHVISVAGTNGKGSTVAFIEAIASAGGYRVGTYTSPHLLRYNERVRIDGREASDAELVQAFEAVEAARTDVGPGTVALTYFEFGTLAALWLLQRADIDLAVLEVGLGGRLDAVNLVDADVAVITTVDLDHVEWLGPDRESIGHEKAGIARAWKPLVLGEVDSPASVLRHAYAIGANAIRMGSDFFHEPVEGDAQGRWRWRDPGFELELPAPSLAAPAQRANAATAIAALRALPIELDEAAYASGVAQAVLPGRLQALQLDGVPVLVDVGHNPQAARQLHDFLAANPVQGRTLAVLATLADKDAPALVEALAVEVTDWFLAGLEDAGSRSQTAAELAGRLQNTAAAGAHPVASVGAALRAARVVATAGDRILVFGSFHTVAEALVLLHSGR